MLTILLLAAVWDKKYGKIPNWLIFFAMICGVGILFLFQIAEPFSRIAAAVFIVFILFPLFRAGLIGAGDIKLISILFLFLSIQQTFLSLLYAFFVAAVVTLFYSIKSHKNPFKEKVHLAVYMFIGTVIQLGGRLI